MLPLIQNNKLLSLIFKAIKEDISSHKKEKILVLQNGICGTQIYKPEREIHNFRHEIGI